MADSQRIEDLRRRVQKDPASIAFAQLGEELRRAGQLQEAVETCRAGLSIHPSYLSARVTLGRALAELDELDEAEVELRLVLKSAPENLAAIRELGAIYQRRGAPEEALPQFQKALSLAPNDPDLQHTVEELSRKVAPEKVVTSVAAEKPPESTFEPFDPEREHAVRQIAALEQWLEAIHVARTQLSA